MEATTKSFQIALVRYEYSDNSKCWKIEIGEGNFAQSQTKITAKAAKKIMKDLGLRFSHIHTISGVQKTFHR